MSDSNKTTSFLLVNVAAQRARQLMQGASPLLRTSSRKPAAIAIREVAHGLIPFFPIEEQPSSDDAMMETDESTAE